MKIDFNKIVHIKTIKDLKKFKINKPIFFNNYLFHYLILFQNLQGLKLIKFPIYKENNDNLNGIHLAAKEYNYNILCYLINTYPEYIYNKNKNNELFTVYIPYNQFYKLIKKYKKLDWDFLLYNNKKLLKNIILNLKYKELNNFINICNDRDKLNLFNIINNPNLLYDEKIKILDTFTDEQLNKKNKLGEGIIFLAFNDIKLYNYLIKRKVDINYYTIINTESPIRIAIFKDILNNKKEYTKNIEFTLEICKELNKKSENIIHSILRLRIARNSQIISINNIKSINYIELDILKICDSECWNQLDINKITPLELLINLDFNIYSNILNNIQINSNILKNIKNENWLKLYKTFNSYNKSLDEININDYSSCTLFQSKFIDIGIFTLYLTDTYKNLYIPKNTLYTINNSISIDTISTVDNIIYNESIFPWIIIFNSENDYYIHPYLNNIINNVKNNIRFCLVFLSLNTDDTLHANFLIYDFQKMIIERFEPYGNTNFIDNYIDDILEEELTWNTRLQYIRPKDFLPYSGFQTISDESNIYNMKSGDFGGFCLAWCLWYLETKMINPDIDSKILVKKLISKLNNLDIKFSEYIRNYANKINLTRIKYLELIGIDSKKTTDLYLNDTYNTKLINYLILKYK